MKELVVEKRRPSEIDLGYNRPIDCRSSCNVSNFEFERSPTECSAGDLCVESKFTFR